MSDPLDFRALEAEANSKLPIAHLLVALGYPPLGNPNRWNKCPACEQDGKFKAWEGSFKCFNPGCVLNPDVMSGHGLHANAAGLVATAKGMDWKEASAWYLREAGVIDEETYQRLTGTAPLPARKNTAPPKKAPAPAAVEPATEEADQAQTTTAVAATETVTPETPAAEPGAVEPEEEPEPQPSDDKEAEEAEAPEDDEPDDHLAVRRLNDGNPWQDLWQMMTLGDGHRTELQGQRGLSRETIELCGFRTSRPGNADLIRQLEQRYSADDLIEYGIMREADKDGPRRPDAQLCGWGITKEKDEDSGKYKFDKVNPVLIPYFDAAGQVLSMRAHKGGLPARILPGEIDHTNYSRPYGEHFLKAQRNARRVLITEGELKAAAVHQCGIPCLAIPGITFIQNPAFKDELLRILSRYHVEEVVIIFDNECKDDPALPNYQKDENKRYDVYIWANVIALKLRESGISRVRVGQLPDQWRERGKADFDGILRQCIEQQGGDLKKGTAAAAKVFLDAMNAAQSPAELIDELFPSRARTIIHSRVIRYTRQRQLLIGGEDEKHKAWLIQRNAPQLAAALRQTDGCYYERKKPDDKKRTEYLKDRKSLIQRIGEMRGQRITHSKDLRAANLELLVIDELLEGWPETRSNFNLKCLYRVVSEENARIEYYCKYYVPLERRKGFIRIPAKPLSRLAEFREFVNGNIPGANFQGSEKALQALKNDLDVDSAYRTINEVNAYGWHETSGLFIWGDVAWDDAGNRILPDSNQVFWHDRAGYQIDPDPERVGHNHDQGAPLMRPGEPTHPDLAAKLEEFAWDFRDNIGGMEAWAVIGTTIGYLAMPAFFRKHGVQHPGIWLHGLFGEGKTSVARMLARFHGFGELKGVPLTKATTDAAINRIIQMYSCLMIFFDEYRFGYVDESRESLFRVAFDRLAISKANMENKRLTVRVVPMTTPLVCGETECPDSATRSRYAQVVVTKRRRKMEGNKERYERLRTTAAELYQVSRELMDRRPEFESAFLAHYDLWLRHIDTLRATINDRSGVTYGVGYAGMATLVEMFSLSPKLQLAMKGFMEFLTSYMSQADDDNRSSGTVEKFWNAFITGLHNRDINPRHIMRRFVQPHASMPDKVSVCRASDPGARPVMLVNIQDAFAQYEEMLRKKGDQSKMTQANLGKYMRSQPWFVWRHSDTWKCRWGGKHGRPTWGVYLDEPDAFPWADEVEGLLDESEENEAQDVMAGL